MATSTEFLQTQILHLDSIFQKACNQVLVLNNFLRELQARYDRASRDKMGQEPTVLYDLVAEESADVDSD